MKGRYYFCVVAHRLSTLRRADLVLVLDHGRIAQRGTHETLVRTDGHYRAVARNTSGRSRPRSLIIQAKRWLEGEVASPSSIPRSSNMSEPARQPHPRPSTTTSPGVPMLSPISAADAEVEVSSKPLDFKIYRRMLRLPSSPTETWSLFSPSAPFLRRRPTSR